VARAATTPALKAFAQKTLLTLQGHQRMIPAISQKMFYTKSH